MEKILVVITTGFDSVGGITSAAMNYIRNIEKNSISFDFCSFNEPNGELLSEITEYGYNYYKLPDRRKKIIQYCQQLYILLKKNRYNIIHIHGNSSTMVFELLVAKIAKVEKRIVHGHAKSTNYPLANKILSPLFNSLYTDAIAVSNESGKWLYKKRFTVINNAIEPFQNPFRSLTVTGDVDAVDKRELQEQEDFYLWFGKERCHFSTK